MTVKTILVIRTSAMGDVAMTAPVVRNLLDSHPKIRVVMLTRGFFTPFFVENDRLTICNAELHGKHKGVRGIRRLYKEIREEFDVDIVADLHDKLYSKLLCFFFKLGGIKTFRIDKGRKEKRTLTRKNNKVFKQLKTTPLRYVEVFEKAGYSVDFKDELQSTDRPIPDGFAPKSGQWIGVAPFAQHAGKMVNINVLQDTIGLLGVKFPDTKVFIFGGGDKEAAVATEIEANYTNSASVIGKVKLQAELDLIANLDVMVSMDSAAMHMSSLVGTRVVSVWGATHPYAGFMGIGQSDSDAVQITDLKCRPCSVYGNKPCYRGDYACLNRITAEMIVDKVAKVIRYDY